MAPLSRGGGAFLVGVLRADISQTGCVGPCVGRFVHVVLRDRHVPRGRTSFLSALQKGKPRPADGLGRECGGGGIGAF